MRRGGRGVQRRQANSQGEGAKGWIKPHTRMHALDTQSGPGFHGSGRSRLLLLDSTTHPFAHEQLPDLIHHLLSISHHDGHRPAHHMGNGELRELSRAPYSKPLMLSPLVQRSSMAFSDPLQLACSQRRQAKTRTKVGEKSRPRR